VTLAKLGHEITILNRDKEIGGTVAALPELYAYLSDDPKAAAREIEALVNNLAFQAKEKKNIRILSNVCFRSISGELGDFSVTVGSNGGQEELRCGAVVLALGLNGQPAAEAAGVHRSPGVVDMRGLMELIHKGDIPGRVAIVTDLTAEQGRAVTAHVLSAAELLVRQSGAQVKIYCNNMRVAATGLEGLYRRTREAGVIIAKSDKKPAVSCRDSKIVIESIDPIAGIRISEDSDLVVIADAPLCANNADTTNAVNGLRPGPEGSLQYDSVWLLPGLTNRPGIFVAGSAHGNSEYRDALMDGLAVSSEIHGLLAHRHIEVGDNAATVDSEKCVLCLTCKRICPHGAISIDNENESVAVSSVSCQRCGICTVACPAQAITLPSFTDEQMEAEIGKKPRVTVFACENSAIPAAKAAAASRRGPKPDLIRVPCAGKVDPRNVLAALEKGAKKVLILGCHPENCQYLHGSSRAVRRMDRLAGMLKNAGFDATRVCFRGISSVEPGKFEEYVGNAQKWSEGNGS